MNHKALLFFFAAVLFAVLPAQAAPASISHFAEIKKSAVVVRITDELKVVLPPGQGGGAGFEWQIISNDSRVLRVISTTRPAPAGERIGTSEDDKPITIPAGSWTTTFVALRPGRSVIRFVYINPVLGKEVTPADTREVVVNVNG